MTLQLSSLQRNPFKLFLPDRLNGAQDYKRIAGYFSSSILEIAGEEIESISGKTTIICNAEIDQYDLAASKGEALREEFYQTHGLTPPSEHIKTRLQRFHKLIESGKLEVKIVGNDKFGLIHGKGGLITKKDGTKTAFIGSANDTWKAWAANYEMVWEDDSPEAVAWMEQEFKILCQHAVPMPQWVIKEVQRIGESVVIGLDEWQESKGSPDQALTPFPLYRQEGGLRAYQEWFVDHIYARYLKNPHDARAILADEVGLGKTLQLALAAGLITLKSGKPCLILVPKTLTEQWQIELADKLALPSARWTGEVWIIETGEEIPNPLSKCPRKIGIVSQGLITYHKAICPELLSIDYGCVVIDEAHRARTDLITGHRNYLMKFLYSISEKTQAFLLGTATPIQLGVKEAHELLKVLGQGSPTILGNEYSKWRNYLDTGLQIVQGGIRLHGREEWEWLRHPLPSSIENPAFETTRDLLGMESTDVQAPSEEFDRVEARVEGLLPQHNPYLSRIIQRSRLALEELGMLPKIKVICSDQQISLTPELQEAYRLCEEFCHSLASHHQGIGFLETMLARRIGSSLQAGLNTVERILGIRADPADPDEKEPPSKLTAKISESERGILTSIRHLLINRTALDKKREFCHEVIKQRKEEGILLFSQYFDTIEAFALEDWGETIAIYAGGNRSCLWDGHRKQTVSREHIKQKIRNKEIKILFGTDAAAEGLNLQSLKHLVNIDCPWNPTRMEQRLGRIRRIGQLHQEVTVTNLRYKDSVEDRVHQRLSERGLSINLLLGTYPESFRDVWIEAARGNTERVRELIEAPIPSSEFLKKAETTLTHATWGYSKAILNPLEVRQVLKQKW